MKTIITISAILIAISAFGQHIKRPEKVELVDVARRPVPLVFDVDAFYRAQVVQPTEVNELPNGTMPLSEDLPMVHTIRGSVYTFDHLRYSVRP